MTENIRQWDVDFSLSLHNRTGKYFIGRDLLNGLPEHFRRVYTWRLSERLARQKLARRVIGRLEFEEYRLRSRYPKAIPLQTSRRSVLHLDPMTVLKWHLTQRDAVLCHDLGPLTHPDLFDHAVTQLYERAYARIAAIRPRMVFASHASRIAFEDTCGSPSSATVIYPPIRVSVAIGRQAPAQAVGSLFLLTVGSVGRRKNQKTAIRAFAHSHLAEAGYQYVICGGREPGFADVLREAEQTPGVVILPYVSDEQLRWLYAHAQGFVLVSLLEGFGMPVAEAMACGLVPLISDASVLEEVAGPNAISARPHSIESIAGGMIKLTSLHPDERARRRRGLEAQLQTFKMPTILASWRSFLTQE